MTEMAFCMPNLDFWIQIVEKKIKRKLTEENMKLFLEASSDTQAFILIEWWNK